MACNLSGLQGVSEGVHQRLAPRELRRLELTADVVQAVNDW